MELAASFRAIDYAEALAWLQRFQDADKDAKIVRFQLDNFNLTEAPWHQCPGCYKQVQENVGGEDELVCQACKDKQEHLDAIDERATLRSRGLL